MFRRFGTLLATIASLAFAVVPVEAGWMMNPYRFAAGATMYPSTCQSSIAASGYSLTHTFSGLGAGAAAHVILLIYATDQLTTFTVDSVTIDGTAATEVFDAGGSASQSSAAIYRTSATQTSVDSITVVPTFSENINNVAVCAWAFTGLNSSTPDSTGTQLEDGSDGLMTLTLTSTNSAGFAVGMCGLQTTSAVTFTWAALTEREDTENAEVQFSNADATATGAQMNVTCQTSTGSNGFGIAAAVH